MYFGGLDIFKPWKKKVVSNEDELINDKNLTVLGGDVEPDTIEMEENQLIYSVDFDSKSTDVKSLVQNYREAAMHPLVDDAIDEIVNEAIVMDEDDIISLDVDGIEGISKNIKNKIKDEFDNILRMLDFNNTGDELFRKWYIDGRLYIQNIVDENRQNKGIVGFKVLSPLNIQKYRDKTKNQVFYVYKDKTANRVQEKTYQIYDDVITFISSALTNASGEYYISYLHRALKPLNQLTLIEDSAVIYRITRSPERRVFYIDTGKLPKKKAEAYVAKLMNRFKNRISYDVATGSIKQKKTVLTMLEDYYFPTSGDSKGTKVDTLEGGSQLGEIDDILYFKKNVGHAIRVPSSRLQRDDSPAVDFGRVGEITREELKFAKFVRKLRLKFSKLFVDILKKQLILKGIITESDWDEIENNLFFVWAKDSYWSEMKETELLKMRLEVVSEMEEYVGKYFSDLYIKKEVLKQTDEEIERIAKENEEAEPEPDDEPNDDGEAGGFGGKPKDKPTDNEEE